MSTDLTEREETRIGRPPRELTDPERQRLAAMAAKGLNQELAGARLGFSGRTLRRLFKRDPDAHLAWDIGRAEAAEEALTLLWAAARDGQPAAMIFLGKALAGLRETGAFGDEGGAPAPVSISFNVIAPDGSAQRLKRVNAVDTDAGDDDDGGTW